MTGDDTAVDVARLYIGARMRAARSPPGDCGASSGPTGATGALPAGGSTGPAGPRGPQPAPSCSDRGKRLPAADADPDARRWRP